MDKFGFKILMFIICFFELGVSATIYYIADNPYAFVIENMLIALSLSGSTMLIPLFHKIFGKDFGAELYGLTGIFIGLASLIGYVNPLIGLPCLFIVIVINLMMAFY